jgi:hypothetical protein
MSSKIRQIAEESKAVLDKLRAASADSIKGLQSAIESGDSNYQSINSTKVDEIVDEHKAGHAGRTQELAKAVKKRQAQLAQAVGVEGEDSTETFYGIVKIAATEGANWQDAIKDTADKRNSDMDDFESNVGEFSFDGEES